MTHAIGLLLLASVLVGATNDENLPPPPYPKSLLPGAQQAGMTVKVGFDKSGKVCGVVAIKLSCPTEAFDEARAFIIKNWHSTAYAGKVEEVPIIFDLPQSGQGSSRDRWSRDFPPAPFYNTRPITVAVHFDQEGTVDSCALVLSSGRPAYDAEMVKWPIGHWHHLDYAGQQAEFRVTVVNTSPATIDVVRLR